MRLSKGNLSVRQKWILALLVTAPLALVLIKLFAPPTPNLLSSYISLAEVPEHMQSRMRYILFVPLGAVLIVFTRLTLGIRVLGPFRSILIAVALQITGILLGLVFLTMVIAIIVMIRPLLRSIRLPYFGRVSVILSTVASIMVLSLLASKWLQIESLRLVGYFPIVVLCLIGEGFARTLAGEGLKSAMWRGAMTALVAVVIALLSGIHSLVSMLLRFPELLVMQIGLIILIAEFFDLRLLQGLNPPVVEGGRREEDEGIDEDFPRKTTQDGVADMKVAVVRNRNNQGIINRFGQPCPEVYGRKTVQKVIDGLRANGHTVEVFEGDSSLLARLREFIPPDDLSGAPTGIVFNMSYGIQGECRYTHLPAMLEMAGVPYTGSSPLGHTLALDKVITKILIRDAGLPTPDFVVLSQPGQEPRGLHFPLIVKPRHESTSYGLCLVRNQSELDDAVESVVTQYEQDALVEEYIDGREVCVGLLGNQEIEFLPIVELDFGERHLRTMTQGDKYHKTQDEPERICPAPLSAQMEARLQEISLGTFRACYCRDYARVDFRIDPEGNPYVLEINSMASLGPGGSFVLAAQNAGYTYVSLVERILDIAHERYFGVPAPRDAPERKIIDENTSETKPAITR